jgi:hypothetical protein
VGQLERRRLVLRWWHPLLLRLGLGPAEAEAATGR